MTKKRLITSALPYVNNVPHLGNLIQVLSADVFSRYCKSRGYDTLYVCGTDEYGTATETKAIKEGISPIELCDKFYVIHRDIYKWFNIGFDHFGRTSADVHTTIVQDIFKKVYEKGFIVSREIKQLYSEASQMFLADRYVKGTCPKCAYELARGDQCESCGALLDSLELINPVSSLDGSVPVVKNTTHLYIDLPKLLPQLEVWVSQAKEQKTWSNNALKMTESWIRDGLRERAITRDLKWGIPVPLKGFENKVFYVWFDAPIGYISITADLTKDWEQWWKNPEEVSLYQFIGKDNIPFHTVVFPSSLIATGDRWTMLHKISSSEYLNYEDGMFSKDRGIGVFGNDVQSTGIAPDVWRFYLMYRRPESSDYMFTWKDFQETVNGELINNLINLCNRTLSFISKNFDGKLKDISIKEGEYLHIWKEVIAYEHEITELFENLELRQAYLKIFSLSSYANKLLQDKEPWNLVKTDPDEAHKVLSNLAYILKELIVLIEPFTPNTSHAIAEMMNIQLPQWKDLVSISPRDTLDDLKEVSYPKHLFKRLEDKEIQEFKIKFSGSQGDRERSQTQSKSLEFNSKVCLKVAKVLEVSPHPDADKLYVLKLDDGSVEGRTIVSGIRDYYTEDDLKDRKIIIVANLKSAKIRGLVSRGMLIAASKEIDAKEQVEVIFVDDAEVGDIICLEGEVPQEYPSLKVDAFFEFTLQTDDHGLAYFETYPLQVRGKDLIIKAQGLTNAKLG